MFHYPSWLRNLIRHLPEITNFIRIITELMKKLVLHIIPGVFALLLLGTIGCKKNQEITIYDPFNTGSGTRDLIVVISDLHCGANLTYAEFKNNQGPLTEMLERIRTSQNVKELVIAGDLVDEWFVPANIDTYQGSDQANFVDRVAAANKTVFDKFREIITGGIIKLTYVPGNHDLAIAGANIDRILPGVNQARVVGHLGLGTYSPANYPQIAIEHGHRFDMFCAPDPISNQAIAPGTILPPGYFYTRIAVLHVVQNCTIPADSAPVITPDPLAGPSQQLLYGYWQNWKSSLDTYPIENHFNEAVIVTNINGFTGNFSVNDVLPYQMTPGGPISVDLYNGIQDNWQERCRQNGIAIPIPTSWAIANNASNLAIDTMASIQYFMNPASNVRLVVFGHTHVPLIKSRVNTAGQKSVYVNSGTWIDENPNRTTMNFVVITPQQADPQSQTRVTLFNLQGRTFNEMNQMSLRF